MKRLKNVVAMVLVVAILFSAMPLQAVAYMSNSAKPTKIVGNQGNLIEVSEDWIER